MYIRAVPIQLLVLISVLLACGPRRDEAVDAAAGSDEPLTAEQQRIREELEAIGYATSSNPAPEIRGVTVNRPGATAPGLTLFTSGHRAAAVLVDMEGRPVHVWRYPFDRVWPDAEPRRRKGTHAWRYAQVLPNGDLLAIFEGHGLIRLDWDSKLLWASDITAHHDLEVLPDGRIWVLTREARLIPRINSDEPVLEDFATLLDAGGRVEESLSLLEVFEHSDLDSDIESRFVPEGDLLHANTLEVLDGSRADLSPVFARGNILTAFRRLSVIAIVDPRRREIVWAQAGRWGGVHYPTLLDDGKILFFANGVRSGASKVIVLDPSTGESTWSYRGSPPESFFTASCGSAQQLANGNVLIAESEDGRIIEVTPEGRIVWELINPFEMSRHPEQVPYVYFATRYATSYPGLARL